MAQSQALFGRACSLSSHRSPATCRPWQSLSCRLIAAIGAALLHAMLRTLARHGWQRVALSVQKANPALRLYQRAGFTIVQDNDEELVMVREIMQ